jgi:hypothetical protein
LKLLIQREKSYKEERKLRKQTISRSSEKANEKFFSFRCISVNFKYRGAPSVRPETNNNGNIFGTFNVVLLFAFSTPRATRTPINK